MPKIDYCTMMRDAKKGNMILAEIVKIAKQMDASQVHQCPYDFLIIDNKPLSLETLKSILPRGDYRAQVNFTNQQNEHYLTMEVLANWFSSKGNPYGN
jgi:hypothetical protein